MKLRKMTEVSALFVLASMTRPNHKVDLPELTRIHRGQGYSKVAVHFLIERDGTVVTGRPADEPGCFAGADNNKALQVCLAGGLDDYLQPTDNFTPQQRRALRKLVQRHGLPVRFDRNCPLQET